MWFRIWLLCLALAICTAPAAAYVEQAENIPGLLGTTWSNKTSASKASVSVITDPLASGGQALRIVDSSTSANDDGKLIYMTTAAGALNGSATAVIRVRTDYDSTFTNNWNRCCILSFVIGPTHGTTRRAIGLAIKQHDAAVVNNLGATIYNGPVAGDNTDYVTWTIVARDYGWKFDLYRNGVKVIDNWDNGSASEGNIGAMDGLSIAASSSNGTGTVIIDWVAYKAGEDPTWNPVP